MEAPELAIYDDERTDSDFAQLPESERLDIIRDIMEQQEPTTIDLDVGEITELNEDTLVKRTEEGIILFNILES